MVTNEMSAQTFIGHFEFHSLSTANQNHPLFNQGIAEISIVKWSCDSFSPLSNEAVFGYGVFWKRNMDKGQVHMNMSVLLVLLLKARGSLLEPLDLIRLDPIVAAVMSFVGRVGMRIKEV